MPVFRPEEEVFSPATLASFEGMPVTDGHPPDPEGVTAENAARLGKGHAHNIRRGAGAESDLLLADLMITDPVLIGRILHGGKREISCGYNYTLSEENGRYVQRQIRGNHVAVVEAGRAGARVSIKDRKPERRMTVNNRKLARFIARVAKDGDTEEVAELLGELIEPEAAPAAESAVLPETLPAAEAPAAETLAAEALAEEILAADAPDLMAEILARLDQIVALLTPAAASAADEPDPVTLAAELIAGSPEEILSEVIEPDADPECDPDKQTADAIKAAILAVRPALAKMPRGDRAAVAADLAGRLRRLSGRPAAAGDTYAALKRAAVRKRDDADLGRRIMAERNPCVR